MKKKNVIAPGLCILIASSAGITVCVFQDSKPYNCTTFFMQIHVYTRVLIVPNLKKWRYFLWIYILTLIFLHTLYHMWCHRFVYRWLHLTFKPLKVGCKWDFQRNAQHLRGNQLMGAKFAGNILQSTQEVSLCNKYASQFSFSSRHVFVRIIEIF